MKGLHESSDIAEIDSSSGSIATSNAESDMNSAAVDNEIDSTKDGAETSPKAALQTELNKKKTKNQAGQATKGSGRNSAAVNDGEVKAGVKSKEAICRRYLLHLKKDRDDLAQAIHTYIEALSDSPVGSVEFEDIVNYLIQEKLCESDFERIREIAFERKLDEKIQQHNRENKTHLKKFEFLAQQCF